MRRFIIAIVVAAVTAALPYASIIVSDVLADGDKWSMVAWFLILNMWLGILLLVNALGWTIARIVSCLRGNNNYLAAAAYANVAISSAYCSLFLPVNLSIGEGVWIGIAVLIYGLGWLVALYPRKPAPQA